MAFVRALSRQDSTYPNAARVEALANAYSAGNTSRRASPAVGSAFKEGAALTLAPCAVDCLREKKGLDALISHWS